MCSCFQISNETSLFKRLAWSADGQYVIAGKCRLLRGLVGERVRHVAWLAACDSREVTEICGDPFLIATPLQGKQRKATFLSRHASTVTLNGTAT